MNIDEIKEKIIPICKSYGVERVFLFGSYARGEAEKKSDVDLRIDKGSIAGLKFGGFYSDVETALCCSVDILTTQQLNKNFLDHIKKEEILLYDRSQQRLSKNL